MVYFPPPSPDHDWDSEDDEEEDGLADQDPLDICRARINAFDLAVCSLPGNRCRKRRSLPADLETLKNQGIQDIYVLCTEQELQWCKVNTLLIDYAMRGFSTHHYPISDEEIPSIMYCAKIIEDIHAALLNGRKVLIHCTDGLGRSCMILALMDMLLNPDLPALLAIEHIRQVRGPGAIKTIKQYNFIMEFHKNWSELKQQQQQESSALEM